MKCEYSFSDIRALVFWSFFAGVLTGLVFSLIWRAAQIGHVEQFTEQSNLTELYSDN